MSFALRTLPCIFTASAPRYSCSSLLSPVTLDLVHSTRQRILLPLHRSSSSSFTSSTFLLDNMSDSKQQDDQKKTYHTKATGKALETVKKRSAENELKLFGSCFWYVKLSS